MKKIITILTILSLLFVITGCDDDNDTSVGDSPFLGGNDGIIASFEPLGIEENGVYTIYDEDPFPIQILVENNIVELLNTP